MDGRERAESKIAVSGLKAIHGLCSDIGELWQVSDAHVAETCPHDFEYDRYDLVYKGGYMPIVTIRGNATITETTRILTAHLKDWRDKYAKVFLNSARILDALIRREFADNTKAMKHGLQAYMVKRLGISTQGDRYGGWPYLILDVGHKEQQFTSPGLRHNILDVAINLLEESYETASNNIFDYSDYIYNGRGYPYIDPFINETITVVSRDNYRRS